MLQLTEIAVIEQVLISYYYAILPLKCYSYVIQLI